MSHQDSLDRGSHRGGLLAGKARFAIQRGIAGYSRGAVLEVVAQAAHTTMANLAHSISQAPVDQAFAAQAWEAA